MMFPVKQCLTENCVPYSKGEWQDNSWPGQLSMQTFPWSWSTLEVVMSARGREGAVDIMLALRPEDARTGPRKSAWERFFSSRSSQSLQKLTLVAAGEIWHWLQEHKANTWSSSVGVQYHHFYYHYSASVYNISKISLLNMNSSNVSHTFL